VASGRGRFVIVVGIGRSTASCLTAVGPPLEQTKTTPSSQTLASLLICSCSVLPLSDALSYTPESLFPSFVTCTRLIHTIYAVKIGISCQNQFRFSVELRQLSSCPDAATKIFAHVYSAPSSFLSKTLSTLAVRTVKTSCLVHMTAQPRIGKGQLRSSTQASHGFQSGKVSQTTFPPCMLLGTACLVLADL
jgi:hypothetical protein